MSRFAASTLGAVLLLAGGARAGVYMEMSDHDVASGRMTPRQHLYAQGGMLRADNTDGHNAALFRDNSFYLLDAASRTYRVVDKAVMDQLGGKVNDMLAAMQSRLASMPPEQRAAMERALQGLGAGVPGGAAATAAHTFDAVDTGASGTAGGRSCRMWNALRDGKPVEQLCVVPESSLPGMGEVIGTIRNAASFNARMQETLQARGGAVGSLATGMGGVMSQNLEVLQRIGGLPVSTRHYDSSTGALAATETVITAWQQQSIDAAQFDIPAGYTRKEFIEGRRPP